jgi:hypothetical protein
VSDRAISEIGPKRPPRFFYRNKILVPFSELKAKLQLELDNQDIYKGFFFYVSDEYVVLLAKEKFVMISRDLQKPILTLEYSSIFKVYVLGDIVESGKDDRLGGGWNCMDSGIGGKHKKSKFF